MADRIAAKLHKAYIARNNGDEEYAEILEAEARRLQLQADLLENANATRSWR